MTISPDKSCPHHYLNYIQRLGWMCCSYYFPILYHGWHVNFNNRMSAFTFTGGSSPYQPLSYSVIYLFFFFFHYLNSNTLLLLVFLKVYFLKFEALLSLWYRFSSQFVACVLLTRLFSWVFCSFSWSFIFSPFLNENKVWTSGNCWSVIWY